MDAIFTTNLFADSTRHFVSLKVIVPFSHLHFHNRVISFPKNCWNL